MELRSVKEEVKNEYPKIEQVKSKKLKKCIPSKWTKMGITSFVVGLILKNTAYATESTQIDGNIKSSSTDIAGGMTYQNEITRSPATELINNISAVVIVVMSVASLIRGYN